jgi:hypothetical protein
MNAILREAGAQTVALYAKFRADLAVAEQQIRDAEKLRDGIRIILAAAEEKYPNLRARSEQLAQLIVLDSRGNLPVGLGPLLAGRRKALDLSEPALAEEVGCSEAMLYAIEADVVHDSEFNKRVIETLDRLWLERLAPTLFEHDRISFGPPVDEAPVMAAL